MRRMSSGAQTICNEVYMIVPFSSIFVTHPLVNASEETVVGFLVCPEGLRRLCIGRVVLQSSETIYVLMQVSSSPRNLSRRYPVAV